MSRHDAHHRKTRRRHYHLREGRDRREHERLRIDVDMRATQVEGFLFWDGNQEPALEVSQDGVALRIRDG